MCGPQPEVTDGPAPRTWGSFLVDTWSLRPNGTRPTHVGVVRSSCSRRCRWRRPPHARGGRSLSCTRARRTKQPAPRTWGSFPRPPKEPDLALTRPTHVGSFRYTADRTCTGRTRPTHVGVVRQWQIPKNLRLSPPHARGGRSSAALVPAGASGAAPRAWGSFAVPADAGCLAPARPTRVGVVLAAPTTLPWTCSPPHARGGRSWCSATSNPLRRPAPRAWGSFDGLRVIAVRLDTRPTHVGVVPS